VKILHVTQGYFPALGGTELVIQRVSEELVSRFHDEVTVFTTDCYSGEAFFNRHLPRMATGWDEVHGVRVRRFHVESRVSGIVRRLQAPFWKYRLPGNEPLRFIAQGPRIPGLRQAIAAFPADVIVASSFPLLHMFDALEAAKRTGRPCVLIGGLHPDDQWGFERRRIYQAIREAIYIAYTTWEADYVISRGAMPERVFVAGAGVDVERFDDIRTCDARRRLGLEPGAPTVGFIGQLGGHKGLDTLLDAMPQVWQTLPQAHLLIAGARSMYVPHLESMVAAWPHSLRRRVTVKYDFTNEEKPDLFAALDVFAYPSGFESFGIAFVEAWAAGKPVVGCRRGAIPSLVSDGVDGLLVTWQDAADLAGAVVTLLADPTRAAAMGAAGRGKARQKYTWRRIGERFRDVYAVAVGSARRD
jgi:glycosyltransferase involved in cell wall biosynthesis